LFVNDFFEEICNEPKNVNHIVRFPSEGQQLNFIGYSYGGLVAAINAMQYTRITGCDVGNLVLIATPILSTNLSLITLNKRIKNLIIHDLIDKGDVLHTGANDKVEIIKAFSEIAFVYAYNYAEKHFYYGKMDREGEKRRRQLADFLYLQGLR
jgi:pimeloyl-ACP methyl ester carboxylesterase